MSTLNLLSVHQAAEELNLSPQRVYQFCVDGRLGQQVAGAWVIPADELEQFARIPRKTGRPAGEAESQPA